MLRNISIMDPIFACDMSENGVNRRFPIAFLSSMACLAKTGHWSLFFRGHRFSFPMSRGVIISQVFPGDTVGESVTIQTYLHEHPQNDEERTAGIELTEFIAHVVRDEDLPMSRDQQQILSCGLQKSVQFGRNEGGLQHFHRWVEHCVSTDEKQPLAELVAMAPDLP